MRRLPPAVAAVGLALLIVVGGPVSAGRASPGPLKESPHPVPSPSTTGESSMPGMDMSGTGMPGTDMSATASDGASMPGMSPTPPVPSGSPVGSASASASMPGMVMDGGSMPGMAALHHGGESAPVARPRAQAVGTFAVVNAGVMIAAAVLRRRTRGEQKRRAAARRTSRAVA